MTAADRLLVIGAGGHAKVVVAALRELGVTVLAIVDDDPDKWGSEILGHPVTGPIADRLGDGEPTILAIGDNATRWRLSADLDCSWRAVVHPGAQVDPSASLAEGVFVAAGAVIQPEVRIEAHAIINTGATVDHDCSIGRCAHLAPGSHLAGDVDVGEGALIGIGATVSPGLSIGHWAVLGAGAAAVRDVAPEATAVGVPARPLRNG